LLWPKPIDQKGLLHELVTDFLAFASGELWLNWITYSMLEATANVVIFLPLGFGLTRLFGLGVFRSTLLALAASGAVELAQLLWLPERVASATDVLYNTLGAMLGAAIASCRAVRRRR
jgi:glycopeptide antibiotics resistance protein